MVDQVGTLVPRKIKKVTFSASAIEDRKSPCTQGERRPGREPLRRGYGPGPEEGVQEDVHHRRRRREPQDEGAVQATVMSSRAS